MIIPIRVLVCRVNEEGIPQAPVVETLAPDHDGDGHLQAMQTIVGGLVDCVGNFDGRGCDLWCNDEALLADMPLNRIIPAGIQPAHPDGFTVIYNEDPDAPLARPGEAGEWRIHGNFFICRTTEDGELADVTDDDVKLYQEFFVRQDLDTLTSVMRDRPDAIKEGRCIGKPIGCGGPAIEFRDEPSRQEYRITGFCQACQDKLGEELAEEGG